MGWDVARARRSNRRWVALAVGLTLLPVLLVAAVAAMPYWWSWTQWSAQQAAAVSVADYPGVPDGATYGEAVAALGPSLYSGPGFETRDGGQTGVYHWRSDAGEIRGLFVDARLVGRLKVGTWR